MARKKDQPIVVSALGTGGVNLSKNPLTMDDNELAQAQNAEAYTDRGQSGVRKRPAYRPINAYATGAMVGFIAVNLDQGGGGNNLGSDGGDGGGAYRVAGGGDLFTSGGGVNGNAANKTAGGWGAGEGTAEAAAIAGTGDIVASGAKGLVLVARDIPTTASWLYTVTGGTAWRRTAALNIDIADTP